MKWSPLFGDHRLLRGVNPFGVPLATGFRVAGAGVVSCTALSRRCASRIHPGDSATLHPGDGAVPP